MIAFRFYTTEKREDSQQTKQGQLFEIRHGDPDCLKIRCDSEPLARQRNIDRREIFASKIEKTACSCSPLKSPVFLRIM